jgi:hypothetical protein
VELVDEPQLNYDKKHGLMTSADLKKYRISTHSLSDPQKPPSPKSKRPRSPSPTSSKSSKKDSKDRDRDRSDKDRSDRERSDKDRDRDRERNRGNKSEDKLVKKHKEDNDQVVIPKGWLIPNIRVRVLNKKVLKGRCYMKKGSVIDVPRPGLAVVRVDDEELCEGIRLVQSILLSIFCPPPAIYINNSVDIYYKL